MLNNFKKQVIVIKDDDGKPVDLLDITTLENSTKLDFLKNDVAKNKKEKREQEEQKRQEQERLNRSKQYDYYYSKAKITLVINYLFTKSQILGDEFLLDVYELLEKVLNDEICVETALKSNEELKNAFELVFGKFSLNDKGAIEQ